MSLIDSHSHIYQADFKEDIDSVIKNSIDNGVEKIILPNVDYDTILPLYNLCDQYPTICYPAMGLHPTSVKENYKEELAKIELEFNNRNFVAVGEIGLDLYWDKNFINQQIEALKYQFDLSLKYNLPVIIHVREAFDEIFEVLKDYKNLKGVFHSFTGNLNQAHQALDMGFYIGFNGILTFKNSKLDEVAKEIPLNKVLLETDAPYLAPVPKRGKRNESAFVRYIADKLADVHNIDVSVIEKHTTQNAINLFNL